MLTNQTSKAQTNDIAVQRQTRAAAPKEIGSIFSDLSTDRVDTVLLHPSLPQVGLGLLTTGLPLAAKEAFSSPPMSGFEMATAIDNVQLDDTFYAFELTHPKGRSFTGLDQVVSAFLRLRHPKGGDRKVEDVFMTPRPHMSVPLTQVVYLPKEGMTMASPKVPGKPGIGNIRIIRAMNIIVGIMTDEHDEYVDIVTMPLGLVRENPTNLCVLHKWTQTAVRLPDRHVKLGFKRHNIAGNAFKYIAEFEDRSHALLTVRKDGKKFRYAWSCAQKEPDRPSYIGPIHGTQLVVKTIANADDEVKVFTENSQTTKNKLVQAYAS